MPNYFPCPNTQCGYQFDADTLPAAAMVTCPLCRTRFPYRAARPVAPPPIPVASDGYSYDASAPPQPTPAASRVVNLRNQPKSGSPLMIVGIILVVGAMLAGMVYFMKYRGQITRGPENTEISQERFNFKMDAFPSGWEEDTVIREKMNINIFARKRVTPDAWVAMVAEDFQTRSPRSGELKDKMLTRLRGVGRNMNFAELDDAKWLGQTGLAFQFQGEINEAAVLGECIAVAYKGIMYIYYMWATDKDWAAVKTDLLAMRGNIKLAGYREKWVEQKTNTKLYTNADPAYTFEDIDAVWQQAIPIEEGEPVKKTDYNVDPKDIDPAAKYAFRARFQIKTGGDTRQHAAEAKALIVELPQGADPLETVKNHVLDRIKADYAGDVPKDLKLEPLTKSPAGITLPSDGPAMARVLFKDPLDRDNRRMYILSAVNVGGKTVGIEIDALELTASYVEEWMVHLASSLRAK